MIVLATQMWEDYELLDSGGKEKLERFGQYVIVRPDPRAIWKKTLGETEWKKADAVFIQTADSEEWKFRSSPPTPWEIRWESIKFALRTTDFRHVGVFPEQAVNWQWIHQLMSNVQCSMFDEKPCRILNLFAYTGGATMAAAIAGAQVTHVDSSRPAMMWASENAKLSDIPKDHIRWIQDDVLKFVKREIRREVKYDGIIMAPPRFGRGASGEVWKLEDDLPNLLEHTRQILSATPLFWLINAYTADLSSIALGNLLADMVKDLGGTTESGELGIKESSGGRILPAGIFARWKKD